MSTTMFFTDVAVFDSLLSQLVIGGETKRSLVSSLLVLE